MASLAASSASPSPVAAAADPNADALYQRRLDRSFESPLSGIARLHDEDRLRVYGLRAVLESAKDRLQHLQDAVDDRDRQIERERDLRRSLEEKLQKRLVDIYRNPALIDELHERLPRAAKSRRFAAAAAAGASPGEGGAAQKRSPRSDRNSSVSSSDGDSPHRRTAKNEDVQQQIPAQLVLGHPQSLPAMYFLLPPQPQQQQLQPQQQVLATSAALGLVQPGLLMAGAPDAVAGGQLPRNAPESGSAIAGLSAGGADSALQDGAAIVKLMGDHSRQTARLLAEIDSLKTLNRKLGDELQEAQQEIERMSLERQLSSATTEAQLAARAAALVQEVYTAQRERDDAVLGRLRLANRERDEALQRLADGDQTRAPTGVTLSREDDLLPTDSESQDFSKLLRSFREADSTDQIEATASSVLDLLRDSQQQQRQVVSREMGLVIEERNAALNKCKQLEMEALQLHRALDDRASAEASDRALRVKLLAVQQERDSALSRVARLEDELQNVRIYYSLHKSLSHEASLRDEYGDALRRLEAELQRARAREEELSGESARLEERCERLDGDKRELLAQLSADRAAAKQAAEREQRLQRLVVVLRRKIQNASASSETEAADDDGAGDLDLSSGDRLS